MCYKKRKAIVSLSFSNIEEILGFGKLIDSYADKESKVIYFKLEGDGFEEVEEGFDIPIISLFEAISIERFSEK
ncbi:MAG: hypothetical protein ACFFDN_23320 [Candidatus Hodarchaeota archaeon]